MNHQQQNNQSRDLNTENSAQNQAIIDEYVAVRRNKIRSENKTIGIVALISSLLSLGSPLVIVTIFFASIGISRGTKFEYETGVESKQKILSIIALIISVFGMVFYYLNSIIGVQTIIQNLIF